MYLLEGIGKKPHKQLLKKKASELFAEMENLSIKKDTKFTITTKIQELFKVCLEMQTLTYLNDVSEKRKPYI